MAKILVAVFAVCALYSIVSAHPVSKPDPTDSEPLMLMGCVYCDTCRCGYETEATRKLPGAVVRIECKNRQNSELTFTKEVVTDSTGHYRVLIYTDRGDDACDAVLVKSADPQCSTPNAGRDRARVILTRNNGMATNLRYANPMGFLIDTPLASCPLILQKYQETEDLI